MHRINADIRIRHIGLVRVRTRPIGESRIVECHSDLTYIQALQLYNSAISEFAQQRANYRYHDGSSDRMIILASAWVIIVIINIEIYI